MAHHPLGAQAGAEPRSEAYREITVLNPELDLWEPPWLSLVEIAPCPVLGWDQGRDTHTEALVGSVTMGTRGGAGLGEAVWTGEPSGGEGCRAVSGAICGALPGQEGSHSRLHCLGIRAPARKGAQVFYKETPPAQQV